MDLKKADDKINQKRKQSEEPELEYDFSQGQRNKIDEQLHLYQQRKKCKAAEDEAKNKILVFQVKMKRLREEKKQLIKEWSKEGKQYKKAKIAMALANETAQFQEKADRASKELVTLVEKCGHYSSHQLTDDGGPTKNLEGQLTELGDKSNKHCDLCGESHRGEKTWGAFAIYAEPVYRTRTQTLPSEELDITVTKTTREHTAWSYHICFMDYNQFMLDRRVPETHVQIGKHVSATCAAKYSFYVEGYVLQAWSDTRYLESQRYVFEQTFNSHLYQYEPPDEEYNNKQSSSESED